MSGQSIQAESIGKAATGIAGLDTMTLGGLPRGRLTLIEGGPGAGKTVLALQTLVNGARHLGEPGIFVAFEESSRRIARQCRELRLGSAGAAGRAAVLSGRATEPPADPVGRVRSQRPAGGSWGQDQGHGGQTHRLRCARHGAGAVRSAPGRAAGDLPPARMAGRTGADRHHHRESEPTRRRPDGGFPRNFSSSWWIVPSFSNTRSSTAPPSAASASASIAAPCSRRTQRP